VAKNGEIHDSVGELEDWEGHRPDLEQSEIFKSGRLTLRELERREMGEWRCVEGCFFFRWILNLSPPM